MSAFERLRLRLADRPRSDGLRVLAASGQLGYGIPVPAFEAGLARDPHVIGADMGSIDPGPYYLGSGSMATSPEMTRRDLRLVLTAARRLDVPLLIGSAGTAGARPHLDATMSLVRAIAREEGLRFTAATIAADIPAALVRAAARDGRIRPIGAMAPLDETAIAASTHIVGQMGTEAFERALAAGADVIVAGRACDTAIFAAVPIRLGYGPALALHMAKIIECSSLCCEPGGRDAMLGTLFESEFELESMNPDRAATPLSVAAHALYEQDDPYAVREPDGTLSLRDVSYRAIDRRRTRVAGATWQASARPSVKIEAARRLGERAVLLCATVDPRVIAGLSTILAEVTATTARLIGGLSEPDYSLSIRPYGDGDTLMFARPPGPAPRELFLLAECVAATSERALMVLGVLKQYLLHHGFPGRLSTGGNIAFPITPPEIATGTAYAFSAYHVMEVDELASLFPVEIHHCGGGREERE